MRNLDNFRQADQKVEIRSATFVQKNTVLQIKY